LAATKHLTKSLIDADANTSNSPNHTAAKPSERPALTNASSSTPKTTSTSTGDDEAGTNSSTTELAPNTTTTTSNSNGTTTTNTQTNSFFSNTESSWDKSTVNTNSKGNSFEENTTDSSTNAATYTAKTFPKTQPKIQINGSKNTAELNTKALATTKAHLIKNPAVLAIIPLLHTLQTPLPRATETANPNPTANTARAMQ
jgi:hypothetical protein